MPYDDSILRELGGYFKAEEPGRRERADAWATAIGLQKVDGLTPSQFLFDTAKEHIEGRITQNQARRRIHDYYVAQAEVARPDPEKEEAGKLRTVNIRKHEWVLKNDSVTYGDAATIKQSLIRDFIDEREFDYGGKTPRKIIPHFARFIAQIWQVHPFGEGNTRTTAVFAIKYLRSLGFSVDNDAFRDNAWYFRNALVRANYADYAREVSRDWSYLEIFFRNLLLGEKNEMKSRYLLIGLTAEDKQKIRELTEEKGDGKKKVAHKSGPSREKNRPRGREESREKKPSQSREKILVLLAAKPTLTYAGLAEAIGLTVKAIEKNVRQLKAAGRLRRVGPDKGGHWEVVT